MEGDCRGYEIVLDGETCEIRTLESSVDCPKCGKHISPNRHHNEKQCRRVQIRKEARAKGRVLPIYIVVLGISRHFGGPEEGGWYYDWRTIHEVRKVWSFCAARKAIRELREEYPKPRYSRFSVLGGEDMFIHVCLDEQEFPRESTEVPRYE